ncbi:MAG TPA: hypothetical protein PK587_04530 [Syntrophales bacterium]|nr:hypothetical protein [Syntrophales bacterium]
MKLNQRALASGHPGSGPGQAFEQPAHSSVQDTKFHICEKKVDYFTYMKISRNMERLAAKYIFDPELTGGKMIFLIGPRQVGKTTLARKWLVDSGSDLYFNFESGCFKP